MNIQNIKIQNFTVFENTQINFTNGVNVIIGENGTGKTHILKLIYAISENYNTKKHCRLAEEFFKLSHSSLMRDKNMKSNITISFSNDENISYSFINDNPSEYGVYNGEWENKNIFIPAKEMLSHSKGFLALNNKYEMPFDKTYIDIITNAELPETKEISTINNKILEIISNVIEGKVVYENDTFYILKKDNKKIEFSLEAEGLRKFGLLYKLIRNGLIEKDTILLWDEPESNINPELIPVLVDVLLMLQREGVQIFIATHSYNLAKYFEIKRKDGDFVTFHSLYKTENGVNAQSDKYFGELENNSIIKADSKLLDEVIIESFEE